MTFVPSSESAKSTTPISNDISDSKELLSGTRLMPSLHESRVDTTSDPVGHNKLNGSSKVHTYFIEASECYNVVFLELVKKRDSFKIFEISICLFAKQLLLICLTHFDAF